MNAKEDNKPKKVSNYYVDKKNRLVAARRFLPEYLREAGCEVFNVIGKRKVFFFHLVKYQHSTDYKAVVTEVDVKSGSTKRLRNYNVVSSIKNALARYENRRTGKVDRSV